MTPDSMLVTREIIEAAAEEIHEHGCRASFANLSELEPVLADCIRDRTTLLAGNLALSGADSELVKGATFEASEIILIVVAAVRRGHYDLWSDTDIAKLLRDPGIGPKNQEEDRR